MRNFHLTRVSFSDPDLDHPIGPVELGDEELSAVQGGTPTFGPICETIIGETGKDPMFTFIGCETNPVQCLA